MFACICGFSLEPIALMLSLIFILPNFKNLIKECGV